MGFSDKFKKHINPETFDAQKAAESLAPTGGLPVPPGEYGMIIEDCSDEKSKKGGEFRKMVFKILAPQQEGRKVYMNFPYECGNESVEQKAMQQIMAIWVASGGDASSPPNAGDMMGRKFIGITSVEFNDYKEGSYNPIIAGVELDRKKVPSGEYPEEKQPAVWADCVEFYKNGGGRKKAKAPKPRSFDDDDSIPF